jgi:hypothetical protein
MEKPAFVSQIDKLKTKESEMSMFQGGSLPFLSTVVDLGFQKVTFSAMSFDESRTSEVDNLSCRIVFVAEPTCVCTLRRCNEQEITLIEEYRKSENGTQS